MKILIMAGTRPEAVKLAPVVRALRSLPGVETVLAASGQHREILAQAFADFDLTPDYDLGVMSESQSLAQLSSRLFSSIDALLDETAPDWVLA